MNLKNNGRALAGLAQWCWSNRQKRRRFNSSKGHVTQLQALSPALGAEGN